MASAIVVNDAKVAKGIAHLPATASWSTATSISRGISSFEIPSAPAFGSLSSCPGRRAACPVLGRSANLRAEKARNPLREEKNKDFRKAALVAVGP